MRFEWNEEKRAANIRKHKVDFLTAALIFENETVERIDDREDYVEERIIALGRVEGIIYRVVYTLRGPIVRIVSAMKASKNEEEVYYREIFS